MSDDSNSHYRSADPYGRAPAPGNDPLAELARLIGQNDPFSEFGRESRPPAQPDVHHNSHYGEQPHDHAAPAEWHNPPPAAPDYDQYHSPAAPEPHYDNARYVDTQMAPPADPYPAAQGHYGAPQSESAHYGAAQPEQPHYGAPRAEQVHHGAPHAEPGHYGAPHAEPGHYGAPHAAYDAQGYGQPAPEGHQDFQQAAFEQPAFQQPAYPHDPSQPPERDEYYDDAPPDGRRKGLVTVIAVLGLAVVGTGAAFGYRTLFGSSHASSSTPPVIRASSEPSKVAPPPQANNDAAAKLSYDRFGDRSQNEQVKVREEQPLDIKELAARAVAPQSSAPAVSNVASVGSSTPVAPAANPPSVLTEPRRVRTVQIHPDQQEPARQPLAQPVMAAAPPPAPRQTPVASLASTSNVPTNLAPEPVAPPRAAAPHVVRTVTPRAAAPALANAPLSLSPDANNAPPPAPTQFASTRSNPRVNVPVSASGHYLVQVSSQRSEADAHSSFRSLKAKYSSVLGDRQPVIRKADLGAKGTYYRAMVGPFASRADAVQLCGSLKAAGGDCVVQSSN